MKKFKLSLIALFCCALLALTGCALELVDTVDFSKSQQKTETITVWMDDSDGVFMAELIPAFNEENPNIVVQFQHMSTVESRSKLKTYGKSGNGADVFQFAHDHLAPALLEDLVYPLGEDVKDRLDDRIVDLAMDIASVSFDETTKTFSSTGTKRLYAVPISVESVNLYYNKALLPDGVPATMDEIIEAATAFNAANSGSYYFATSSHWADSYFNQYFFSAFGWRPFGVNGNDESSVGFESANLANAVEWMLKTLRPVTTGVGSGHNSLNGTTLFQEGKVAILLTGPWAVADMAAIDFGIAQMPTVTVGGEQVSGSTFAGSQMVAVYKHSEHIEAATKFVEFLASDTAAEILFRTSGDVPALKDEILTTIPGVKDSPVVQAITDQLETSIPMPTIPSVAQYWTPAEDLMKQLWNNTNADVTRAAIEDELKTAEEAYLANKNLSGTN